MEKKQVRLTCRGCGTAFKLKVPVTSKPVSFKCRKCGKVLKIRMRPAAREEAPASPRQKTSDSMPELLRNQLPDSDDFKNSRMEIDSRLRTPSAVEVQFPGHAQDASAVTGPRDRRWVMLSDDTIRGPFTNDEIRAMIVKGEVVPSTSIRLGDRPWIKAGDVPEFAQQFRGGPKPEKSGAEDGIRSVAEREQTDGLANGEASVPFYEDLRSVIPYPFRGGNCRPIAVFALIAFALSSVLCLNFTVGLVINLIGWIFLYGYLATLIRHTVESPEDPPPAWQFSQVKDLGITGSKVLAVLLAFALVPVSLCLLAMIGFFLNSMPTLGYIFMGLTVLVFAASLLVIPASIVMLSTSGNLGQSLSPSRVVGMIKKTSPTYLMLAVFSVVTGMVCMVVTIVSLFLVEIPAAGFLVAGLLMALVFSYGHFVWFHVMGRFSGENQDVTGPAASIS
jgi:predicted RNA-binding Zn-ribbon protein involved in translation (DUF1610 family)